MRMNNNFCFLYRSIQRKVEFVRETVCILSKIMQLRKLTFQTQTGRLQNESCLRFLLIIINLYMSNWVVLRLY